jgi:hypothetical protein
MAIAVIELHDFALRCGTGTQLIEVPGHALVTPRGILTGAEARARAWLEPRHSFDQHWQQLGMAALPVASRHARHFADLAHAQLLALHQAAGAPERVVFAVPGSMGREQLAVLLGIANAAPFAVAGLVDAALAAAVHGGVSGSAVHLELLRHCAVLTALHAGARVERRGVTVLPELGLNRLHELWARHIAERFIASHRYDPLHTGAGEQALREALPGWLATLAVQPDAAAVLRGPRGPLAVTLTAAELAAAADAVYARLAAAVREAAPGERLLAAQVAALPGIGERLRGRALPAAASIAGCLARIDAITARPANVLITQLPAGVEQPRAPDRPLPSHLLWGHRAHAIGSGLALALDGDPPHLRGLSPAAAGTGSGPLLAPADGRLTLRGAPAGLRIEGDPEDLRAGDRLRIGGESLELIEVL